ncbi:hypothetical protein ACC736_39265, partial [Rhizobium ruizarguesonis]
FDRIGEGYVELIVLMVRLAIERLEDEALPRWQAMLDDVADDIRRKAAVFELTPPAFCMFEDMKHFHELLIFDFEA